MESLTLFLTLRLKSLALALVLILEGLGLGLVIFVLGLGLGSQVLVNITALNTRCSLVLIRNCSFMVQNM